MYAICSIIYGVPYTIEVEDALLKAEGHDDYMALEEHGWQFEYSGSSNFTPGYLGSYMDGIDEADQPARGYPNKYRSSDDVRLQPTAEDRRKWHDLFAKQPDWVKEVIDDPKVYFIWSTS